MRKAPSCTNLRKREYSGSTIKALAACNALTRVVQRWRARRSSATQTGHRREYEWLSIRAPADVAHPEKTRFPKAQYFKRHKDENRRVPMANSVTNFRVTLQTGGDYFPMALRPHHEQANMICALLYVRVKSLDFCSRVMGYPQRANRSRQAAAN